MKYTTLLFLFTFTVSFGQRSDFKQISFKKADSIANTYKGESLKNLPLLTQNLTCNLDTDVEKFRAIYTWVCTNIENDYSSYLKTKKNRKKIKKDRGAFLQWNSSFTPKVFKKLLNHKKTACTGYAYLIRELASLADLECKIINGFGRTANLNLGKNSLPNHSWNVVKLNGKWYFCDATWSAGKVLLEEGKPKFKADYFDGYFLGEPSIFIKNHYPLDLDWTLMSNAPSYAQFINGPIVYKEAYTNDVIPISPGVMHIESQKNKTVRFELLQTKPFTNEEIALVIINGSGSKTSTPETILIKNKCILTHTFNKTGHYDVHIKVDELIIATYTVKTHK